MVTWSAGKRGCSAGKRGRSGSPTAVAASSVRIHYIFLRLSVKSVTFHMIRQCLRWLQMNRIIWRAAHTAAARRALLEKIIRVDHAGELGADRIYAGQLAVLGRKTYSSSLQIQGTSIAIATPADRARRNIHVGRTRQHSTSPSPRPRHVDVAARPVCGSGNRD
ncbi:hypothetical protein Y032_0019g3841 [Ancylostoma ceylanicum]|uniref:Uncharacterized protein n=1 Tax=Ancylostoma ceylanicum TaxID=53326 RepID=A0A016V384_9BILA|nr:hypothetical protein Y032_0019g3841 [Ancylostoma ceylanicum]